MQKLAPHVQQVSANTTSLSKLTPDHHRSRAAGEENTLSLLSTSQLKRKPNKKTNSSATARESSPHAKGAVNVRGKEAGQDVTPAFEEQNTREEASLISRARPSHDRAWTNRTPGQRRGHREDHATMCRCPAARSCNQHPLCQSLFPLKQHALQPRDTNIFRVEPP